MSIKTKSRPNTFIDLFSGIGGFHLACKQATEKFENPKKKAKCVFACEIDENARKTYINHFGKIEPYLFANNRFATDVTQVDPNEIEDFRLLCAGFPCQPFSSIGKRQGFDHPTQGTLFYDVVRIMRHHRNKAFLLENVAGLQNHDGGRTLEVIQEALTELGGFGFH